MQHKPKFAPAKSGPGVFPLWNMAFWLVTLLYLELLLHLSAFGAPDLRFGFVVGFSLSAAALLSLVTSFLPRKLQTPVAWVLTLLLILLYGSQLVYNFVFGTLYSVAQMQMGGDALTSFWKETLLTMWNNLPWLLLALLPLVLLGVLLRWKREAFAPTGWTWRAVLAVLLLAVYLLTVGCLYIGGTGDFSNYDFYYSDSTTDQAAQRFGLLTAFRLDLFQPGFGKDKDNAYYTPLPTEAPPTAAPTDPSDPSDPPPETEPPITYNVLDLDFDRLNSMTEDETILAINNYCASLSGTNRNQYTGMLRDYNLIVLCAESFSPAAIDPELTPTLYRLANEGIVFQNYYNTYPNNTSDGEYSLCTGLFPDNTRGKSSSSFYASRAIYLPNCLGNVFQEQLGIQSYGYHNYSGHYYGREKSHPNMGYTMAFAGSHMTFSSTWPASDLEMMEQSIDDYIGQDQFHAYYMTFSGHMAYDVSTNSIAAHNWSQVKDLPYGYHAKCYLACNLELEKAMTYLMERLEEAGVADKTAIVLTADHFPYGLSTYEYAELVDYELDHFSQAKSSLIFWVGGLEEPIQVEEYCCNVDILPTILNLWGFEYDSRLLAGTDVFSDGPHMAILIDKSFLTDKVWMDTSTGEIRYLTDEQELPEGYVDNLIKLVKTKFSLSVDILNTGYYNFIFGKELATPDHYIWGNV